MERINLNICGRTYEFCLVDSVPFCYQIWNIGKNMPEGYLPLVQTGGYDGCQVNIYTMMVIKIEEAQTILAAVGYGARTVKDMEAYVRKHKGAEVDRMKRALPIMKTIKGL